MTAPLPIPSDQLGRAILATFPALNRMRRARRDLEAAIFQVCPNLRQAPTCPPLRVVRPKEPLRVAPSPEVLTAEEVAALLRVDVKTLYSAINAGQVPGVIRLGKKALRLSRQAVLDWLRGKGRSELEESKR